MSELSLAIDKEKDNLKYLITEKFDIYNYAKKQLELRKILLDLANKINESNKTEFYDLLKELFRINSDYFFKFGYTPLIKKFIKKFGEELLFEMETYLINTLCLGTEEKLLISFNGKAIIQEDTLNGRLHLTNKRIIGIGKIITKKPVGVPSYLGLWKDHIRKQIRKALQQISGEDILFFGNQIPITGTYNVNKNPRYIKYFLDVTLKKEKKTITRMMRIKIIPKPMKKDNSKEGYARRIKVLDTIRSTLS